MPANTKTIKTRIKSVKNTKKMTKAMEMVSAAKMRKAVEAALATRTYATLARELMQHMAHVSEPNVPLLERREVKNVLVILVSSNRGLCGSFNANLFKTAGQVLADTKNISTHRANNGEEIVEATGDAQIHIMGIGKKSALFAKKHGYNLVSVYDHLSEKPSFDDILPIAEVAIDAFKKGTYDKVMIAYTDYKSSLEQIPKFRQLLPISAHDLEKMLRDLGKNKEDDTKEGVDEEVRVDIESYLFEPGLDEVLDYVLPRLVETQLYQAVLESAASEHSARMMAMKNASDSAGDLIDELNLTYNKARQASITQEIAEIVGGAAALE